MVSSEVPAPCSLVQAELEEEASADIAAGAADDAGGPAGGAEAGTDMTDFDCAKGASNASAAGAAEGGGEERG